MQPQSEEKTSSKWLAVIIVLIDFDYLHFLWYTQNKCTILFLFYPENEIIKTFLNEYDLI